MIDTSGRAGVSAGQGTRLTLLCLAGFLTAAGCLTVGVAGIDHVDQLNLLIVVVLCGITLAGLIAYRPMIFPFAFYLCAVPFDNLLQTGSGTITKYLAVFSALVVMVVMADRRRVLAPPLALGIWGLLLLWCIMSMSWSQDASQGWPLLAQILQLFGLYAIFSIARIRFRELQAFAGAVVGGGVISAVYGVWLYSHGSGVIANGVSNVRLNIVFGTHSFINADHFAGALILPIALALVAALRPVSLLKMFALAALGPLLYAVLLSASRGSAIAIAAMWLYLLIVYRQRLQLALGAAAALAASAVVPNVWLRFADPTQGDAGGRFGIWAIAYQSFLHHWLIGIGSGQFRLGYSEAYLSVSLTRNIHAWAEDSHNLIAGTAVEIGVIGLGLMLWAWYGQFRIARMVPSTSAHYELRIALEAAVIGLFIVAMTADVMWYKYLWLAFMFGVFVRNSWLSEGAKKTALDP